MSRKGVRKPRKVISSQIWKSKRRQEMEKTDSSELCRNRAKILIKQLRRAAKKGKITSVSNSLSPYQIFDAVKDSCLEYPIRCSER